MDQPITRAEHISIHALREEGDPFSAVRFWLQKVFLSTPSARRATNYESTWRDGIFISIHALREEGDGQSLQKDLTMDVFLSTPSARRATRAIYKCRLCGKISIHALREEGDTATGATVATTAYFYPRPPRGGRQPLVLDLIEQAEFLSTPSARRATFAR